MCRRKMSLGSIFFTSSSLSSIWTSNCRNLGAPVSLLRTLASTSIFHHSSNAKQCRSSSSSSWKTKKNSKRSAHCSISVPREVETIASASSFNGYSGYNRLLPCPTENGPPRVEHLVVSEEGPVLDYICKVLDLPRLLVADLIHFGAVYYALVCPKPPPSATPNQIRIFEAATAPSVLKKRTSIKGKTVREAQKTFRITHVDEFVEAGTYLRVHVHPKRFPRALKKISYSGHNRLFPCPTESGPPRVEHLVVSEGGPVLDYICKVLDLPSLFVADLIHFGAVYYAIVSPKPPPSATPEQIRIYKATTMPSVLAKRTSIKGKTVREAQNTFRITHVDEFVEAGTYLRVHVHPKRFPRCYEIDWKSRILAVAESYVVLDKPAGTSVGGTTDNIEESCVTFATRALGFSIPLKTTHQIDNCTEGCVVLARTKEYCSVFHGKIREKKVKKLYLALAAAPMPIGIVTHFMRPINMAPRIISKDFVKGWHMCQLEILECKEVMWPTTAIEEKYCVEDCGWPSKDFAYECKINLLTGKTHQIRTQLAAYGAPIVGDSMYMPAAIAEMANPGLNPFGNHKKQDEEESEKTVAVDEWIAQHGKEPSVSIGLQACQISWDDGEHFYKAGPPWWRLTNA